MCLLFRVLRCMTVLVRFPTDHAAHRAATSCQMYAATLPGEPSWSLLYRLRNGALAGRDAGVKVVVLATGTNDLTFNMDRALHEPRPVAEELVKR